MDNISQTERELVIIRLQTLSPELHFSSGGRTETFTRDELIEHIKRGDEIANEYIKIELEFLRAMKDGTITKQLVTS